MPNHNDSKTKEQQNLLGDLESIKRLLDDQTQDAEHVIAEKIPILLDAVPTVPVLKDVVAEGIAATPLEAPTTAVTQTPQSQPVTNATEAQLVAEGEQLIENLLEEYLPMMEARLREQLRLRLNFIIKEQMRKYR